MKVIDDPHASAFAVVAPAPAQLAHAARSLHQVARFGVRSQIANQVLPLVKVEQLVRNSDELGQFSDCLHGLYCNPLGRLFGLESDAMRICRRRFNSAIDT